MQGTWQLTGQATLFGLLFSHYGLADKHLLRDTVAYEPEQVRHCFRGLHFETHGNRRPGGGGNNRRTRGDNSGRINDRLQVIADRAWAKRVAHGRLYIKRRSTLGSDSAP